MFIDTHSHLFFSQFDDDRASVIGNAKKAGVKKFISPGVDPTSCGQTMALARMYKGVVYPAIGFHPYEAQEINNVSLLEKLLDDSVVAVGECGLDYHIYKGEKAEGKKQNQKILFEEHLRFAAKHNLPVSMHVRDAFEDFFAIIDSQPSLPRGVIHCFSGGTQEIRMAEERKLSIGVDGNLTYSKQLQQVIPSVPLPMILLETDAPYLTPLPHRGQRNEPKYIPLIAQKVAELHGITAATVEEQTTANATRLFQLS